MSLRANLTLCLLLPLLLSGCGFTPLYAKRSPDDAGYGQLIAGVKIDPIGERMGQQLRAALEDQLNANGVVPEHPAYRLTVQLGYTTGAIGVARDGTVSRYNVYLDSKYILRRTSDDLIVTIGNVRRVSSYNNLANAYFSTYVSEGDAIKRGIDEMSQDYRQRLTAYLTSPHAGEAMNPQPDAEALKKLDSNQLQSPSQNPFLNPTQTLPTQSPYSR